MAIDSRQGNMGPAEAARNTITEPSLDLSIKGVTGALFSVKGGKHLTLSGVNTAGEPISNSIRQRCHYLLWYILSESFGEEVKQTLITTGLEQDISCRKATSLRAQRGKGWRKVEASRHRRLLDRSKKQ